MIIKTLKKTGRAVLLLFLAVTSVNANEQIIEATISPGRIGVGERATLSLKVPDGEGDIKPVKVPAVRGLRIDYSGAQHSFQFINGRTWRGMTLNFTITAEKKGTYYIPTFIFKRGKDRLKSQPVSLSVVRGVIGGRGDGRSSSVIRSLIEIDKKGVYTGEPVIMRYYLLTAGGGNIRVQGMSAQPESKGCVINKFEESREDAIIDTSDGEMVKSHIFSFAVVPAATGTLNIGGGTAVIAVENPSSFFDFQRQARVDFETLPLKVKNLPEKGRPDKFSGNVGTYTLQVEYNRKPVKVFDERRITVKVSGKGNIAAMARPVLGDGIEGVRVLAEDGTSSVRLGKDGLEGEREFHYTIIPEKAGELDLGKLRLNFFDNRSGSYSEAVTDKIVLTVTGDSGKNNRIAFDEDKGEEISVNAFAVVFVILLVCGAIIFLVMWERKRYHIISGSGESKEEDEVEEEHTGESITSGLTEALDARDSDAFFKAADRIFKHFSGDASVDSARLHEIKDEMYGLRFGGGEIDSEKMEDVYTRLKDAGVLR